jgi:D-alanine-D-alanine ligase-like ATP-grasp enzyme
MPKPTSVVVTPSRRPAVSLAPVERFIQEVLPTIPGPHQVAAVHRYPVLIRRAARRRGLSIRTSNDVEYLYDGQIPVGGVKPTTSTLNSPEARSISWSKDLTKEMFTASGLPYPAGIILGPDQLDEALAHIQAMGRPAVLKPTSAKQGRGVTCGIVTEDDLRAAWTSAGLAREKPGDYVLEEQIEGIDLRVCVIGRRAVAATVRLPSYVLGDGRSSLTELIDRKQLQRAQNAFLVKAPVSVDAARLRRDGRTLDDVPVAGEVVVLTSLANISAGGVNVDVTDLVHPGLLRLAVDAARAAPGLRIAGVDLIAPDLDSVDGAAILELNHTPGILLHHYPAYGEPRDIAGAIVDEMIAAAGLPHRSPRPRRTPVKASVTRRLVRAARRRRLAD